MNEDRVFCAVSAAIMAVLGSGLLFTFSSLGVPMWSLVKTGFFVYALVVLFLCWIFYVDEHIPSIAALPAVVGLFISALIPSIDWLAGLRERDDFPLRPDVAWYGSGGIQMLFILCVVALGYFLLWRSDKLRF